MKDEDMSAPEKAFGQGSLPLSRYALEVFRPEDATLAAVRTRALEGGLQPIAVHPMDGRHLELLARACGAKRIVEIGTLGGYSASFLARALPEGGKLWTCEIDPRAADIARESFRSAGVSEKIEVLVGPALESLPRIEAQGPFDVVFIDADKVSYPHYLAWARAHLRAGGLVIADNTFAWGFVVRTDYDNPKIKADAQALDAFNRALASDPGFCATIFPTGEGLTVGIRLS